MGVGATNPGGPNSLGSPRAPMSVHARPTAGTPAPVVRGAAPTPNPTRPAVPSWAASAVSGNHPHPATPGSNFVTSHAAHPPVAPASPSTGTPAPVDDPNIYHDSRWETQTGQLGANHDLALTALNGQLGTMREQFTQGLAGLNRWHEQNLDSTNASLAARGIYNSGGHDQAAIDRAMRYDPVNLTGSDYYGLRNTYGDLAQTRVGQQIADANNQYNYGIQTASQDAIDRYKYTHPIYPGATGAMGATPPPAAAPPATHPATHPAARPAATAAQLLAASHASTTPRGFGAFAASHVRRG